MKRSDKKKKRKRGMTVKDLIELDEWAWANLCAIEALKQPYEHELTVPKRRGHANKNIMDRH